ncbi:LacI family DNA-binding transcriptional regulator [Oceanobacillus oncorhynchi subsp. oncorhynchi]|uniref:LacI family DNA-binding transcriptional regulator n=1 Tax=Oceanobacillus oncorhynchi TaxID=545501 RepID=UPI0036427FB8
MKSKVTIKDVAKKAGVSISTVSRVMNKKVDGSIDISVSTVEKVLKAATELGYRRNPLASALHSNKTGLVGVVVRDISDPFLNKMLMELQHQFQAYKQELFIGQSNDNDAISEKQLSVMIDHWFDGLIILTEINQVFIDEIEDKNIPYVTVYGTLMETYGPSVQTNDKQGIEEVMAYLKKCNHKKIGYIGLDNLGNRHRKDIFMEIASPEFVKQEWIREINSLEEVDAYVKYFSTLEDRPTALFCSNDSVAIHVMMLCNKMGIDVPKDLSIIGFDDIKAASNVYPTLTTVRQPYRELASQAISIVMNRIDNKEDIEKELKILNPSLVIRESCTAIDDE